jgi:hypothetical protein
MGHALLWLESLAAALLFEATVAAVAARWSPRWGWRILPLTIAFLLLSGAVALSVTALAFAGDPSSGSAFLLIPPPNSPAWEAVSAQAVSWSQAIWIVAWTVSLSIGTAVLYWRCLRSRGEPPAPPAASWPRHWLALSWLAALALLAITFSTLDQAVKVQLASLRGEAGAIVLAQAPPRLPDRENAALLYRRAFEILRPLETVPDPLRDKVMAWRNYERAKIDPRDKDLRDYLRVREPALVLLRKAAAMPGCSFDYNYLDGVRLLLPELQYLRQAAHELALDIVVKAADGDSAGALDDVAALHGIAGHFNEPFLISLMMSVAVEKSAARALEETLTLSRPRAGDLARLTLDPVTSYQTRLHRCLIFEESLGLSAFGGLGSGDANWLIDFNMYQGSPWLLENLLVPAYRVFLLTDDLASYRATLKGYQNATKLPFAEVPQWWNQNRPPSRGRGILTRILVPGVRRGQESAVEGDASRHLAQAALALASYRVRTGRFPEKLDDLVPKDLTVLPRDPFDGKPLRYQPGGKEVRVYSIGPDLKDDGGKPWNPVERTGDLVFRLPR